MSRHNRRRTRGGHKAPQDLSHEHDVDSISLSRTFSRSRFQASTPLQTHFRRNDPSARHWHNRYIAWQNRERRQAEERKKLEDEQQRIFGGDDGESDEDGLCQRMMEYFGTLDFIDNSSLCRNLSPGD
ncbi:hypothetical protein MMC14_000641 [Varicellaria rhodocarpa]|nr:hypothetical protein [Varicellaria rhodocarpa]